MESISLHRQAPTENAGVFADAAPAQAAPPALLTGRRAPGASELVLLSDFADWLMSSHGKSKSTSSSYNSSVRKVLRDPSAYGIDAGLNLLALTRDQRIRVARSKANKAGHGAASAAMKWLCTFASETVPASRGMAQTRMVPQQKTRNKRDSADTRTEKSSDSIADLEVPLAFEPQAKLRRLGPAAAAVRRAVAAIRAAASAAAANEAVSSQESTGSQPEMIEPPRQRPSRFPPVVKLEPGQAQDGLVTCPSCGGAIYQPKGFTCRTKHHRPNFFYFCFFCRADLGTVDTLCQACPHRNNSAARDHMARELAQRNAQAKEHRIELSSSSSDDDEELSRVCPVAPASDRSSVSLGLNTNSPMATDANCGVDNDSSGNEGLRTLSTDSNSSLSGVDSPSTVAVRSRSGTGDSMQLQSPDDDNLWASPMPPLGPSANTLASCTAGQIIAIGAGAKKTHQRRFTKLMLPHKTVIGKAAVALDNLTLQNSCRRLFMARKRSAAGPGRVVAGHSINDAALSATHAVCYLDRRVSRQAFPCSISEPRPGSLLHRFAGKQAVVRRDLLGLPEGAEDVDSGESQPQSQDPSSSSDGEEAGQPSTEMCGDGDDEPDILLLDEEPMDFSDMQQAYNTGDGHSEDIFDDGSLVLDESDDDPEDKDDERGHDVSRRLRALELYAGCGGFGHIAGRSRGVDLEVAWAVECEPAMCATYRHNHPKTAVYEVSAGLFFKQIVQWTELRQQHHQKHSSADWERLLHTVTFEIKNHMVLDEDGDDQDIGNESEDDDFQDSRKASWHLLRIDSVRARTRPHRRHALMKTRAGRVKEVNTFEYRCRLRRPAGREEIAKWVSFPGGTVSQNTGQQSENGWDNLKLFLAEFVCRCGESLPLPGNVDLVNGGPPCQGFSGHNLARVGFSETSNPFDNPKNAQLKVFCNYIRHLRPDFMIIENVVGLVSFEDGYCARHVLGELVSADYNVGIQILHAGSFGVPQSRPRVIIFAAGLGCRLPKPPVPTHPRWTKKGVQMGTTRWIEPGLSHAWACRLLPVSEAAVSKLTASWEGRSPSLLSQAFTGLAAFSGKAYPNNDKQRQTAQWIDRWELLTPFEVRRRARGAGGALNHDSLPLSEDDYHRVQRISKLSIAKQSGLCRPPFADWRDLHHASLANPYSTVPSGKPLVMPYMWGSKNKDNRSFRRLDPDEACQTLICRGVPHNQAILHPEQDRTISVREAARIQGFDDNFVFLGSIEDQYKQVGNAVCCKFAAALGQAVREAACK